MVIETFHDQFPRKYVAGPGIEPGTFDLLIRRATDKTYILESLR